MKWLTIRKSFKILELANLILYSQIAIKKVQKREGDKKEINRKILLK